MTYDGSVDPPNWLNHCEQFFWGQRTLASDRTWLASYHLRGKHRRGTTPWNKMKACRHGSVSATNAVYALVHRCGVVAWPSWVGYLFSPLCRSLQAVSKQWPAMPKGRAMQPRHVLSAASHQPSRRSVVARASATTVMSPMCAGTCASSCSTLTSTTMYWRTPYQSAMRQQQLH